MRQNSKKALTLHTQGKLVIIPVIVRTTDFDIDPLKGMMFLPEDANAVNPVGAKKEDFELRDKNWTHVSRGLKSIIDTASQKQFSISLTEEHKNNRVKLLNFKHLSTDVSDIIDFFQEPEIVHTENNLDIPLNSINDLAEQLLSGCHFLAGDDQSGKTTILLYLQHLLVESNIPCVLISGEDVNNNQVDEMVCSSLTKQLNCNQDIPPEDTVLFIDDFDECRLSESRQRKFLDLANSKYKSVLLTCFSPAFAGAFKSSLLENIFVYSIEVLPANKIYELVESWIRANAIGLNNHDIQSSITNVYQVVLGLLNGGAIPAYPPMIMTFLRVADSSTGADLSVTSNAACYDSLISLDLGHHNVPSNRIDAAKSFLGFLASVAFVEGKMVGVDTEKYADIKSMYSDIFFDDISAIESALFSSRILHKNSSRIVFKNKFLGYFFVGRHIALYLKEAAPNLYKSKVDYIISNVRYRASANILIYCIYFSSDVDLIRQLVEKLSEKFSDVDGWELRNSDIVDSTLGKSVLSALELSNDVRVERFKTIENSATEKYQTGEIFADYANPYSSLLRNLLSKEEDTEQQKTFMSEMNSLFRLQSIIGSALNTRQGTFTGLTIMECADAIVQATGRFSVFNLNFARNLNVNLQESIHLIEARFPEEAFDYLDGNSIQLKRQKDDFIAENVQSIVNLHGRWIVFSAQAVAGRVLSSKIAVEALRRLSIAERDSDSDAVNFQITHGISSLFHTNKINRDEYENQSKLYGDNNLVFQIAGYSVYVFSRFMPIDFDDRHWLNAKFNFRKGLLNVRQRKFLSKHEVD